MSSNVPNKNAIVQTRLDRTGKLRTETARRDSGFDVAITTDPRSNSTRVFIDRGRRDENFPTADVELNGHEARTLFLVLAKHFVATGKTITI